MDLRLMVGDAETIKGLQKARLGNLNLPRDRYVDLGVVAVGAFVVIDRNGKDMPWCGIVDENGLVVPDPDSTRKLWDHGNPPRTVQ